MVELILIIYILDMSSAYSYELWFSVGDIA